ncbi:MAG: hypothetical protein AB7F96_08065 [Beijerinckiaceae bacterium]
MSDSLTARPAPKSLGEILTPLAAIAGRRETAFAIVLFAVLQQSLGHHNADNSWLFTVAEKYMDGARIYTDVIETNPPASFLIYVPAAALARLLHLPVEFMASAFVFVAALASLAFASSVAARTGLLNQAERGVFFNAGIFALLLVPGLCFAQREHVALLAMLPVLAVYAARARGAAVPVLAVVVSGALAGLALAIKFYFAAALALPALFVCWHRRSFAPAFAPENFAAAAVALAYGAFAYFLFPGFFEVLPALLDTYVAVKLPLAAMLASPLLLLSLTLLAVAAYGLTARMRQNGATLLAAMFATAAAGFTFAAVVQGKGWLNHYLPGLALGFLALAACLAPAVEAATKPEDAAPWTIRQRAAGYAVLAAALLLPLLYGAPQQLAMTEEYPGLRASVQRLAPKNPKIMAVAVGLDVGFPLTRQVGGVWPGRQNMLWLMAYARILRDRPGSDKAKMQAYIDADAAMFSADVARTKPDVILVGRNAHVEKILAHPVMAAALATYTKSGEASGVDILRRD